MNFNTNLCKGQYYKYFNLRKKYLINNANILYNLKCKEKRSFPHMRNAGSLNLVLAVATPDHHVHSM